MPATLYEHDRMGVLIELDSSFDVVDAATDAAVIHVGVDIIVRKCLHHFEFSELRTVLSDGQNQPFVVVFVTTPGDALIGVIAGVEDVVDEKPVTGCFHRRVVDVGLRRSGLHVVPVVVAMPIAVEIEPRRGVGLGLPPSLLGKKGRPVLSDSPVGVRTALLVGERCRFPLAARRFGGGNLDCDGCLLAVKCGLE